MPTEIKIGDTFSLEKTISLEMVQNFADFSGDYNPVHMDDKYCQEHGLGSRVVHGMLLLSFLSTFIGMHLPGPGALWLSQSIDFISPVRIDDSIKITGKVTGQDHTNALGLNIIVIKIE
ncbi:MAG: MaoC family dehydratase, partial [Dehalobacterium sp.]